MSAVELTRGLTLYDVIPGPLPIASLYKSELPTKGTEQQRNAERASEEKLQNTSLRGCSHTALR